MNSEQIKTIVGLGVGLIVGLAMGISAGEGLPVILASVWMFLGLGGNFFVFFRKVINRWRHSREYSEATGNTQGGGLYVVLVIIGLFFLYAFTGPVIPIFSIVTGMEAEDRS